MKTVEIREKLHRYIDNAEEKKIKAIFAMVEEEIEERSVLWEDENFISYLKEEEAKYLKGNTITFSLEKAISRSMQAVKNVKRKK